MKEKTNYKYFILIGVVLLIIGATLIHTSQLNLLGFTTMSISTANYIENGEVQEAYVFNIVASGGAESITMKVNPESAANAGLKILPKPFTVKTELVNPVCVYRIEDTADKVYRLYQATSRAKGWGVVGLSQPCPYNLNDLDLVKDMCKGEIENECNRGQPSNVCYAGGSTTQGYPTGTGVISPGSNLPQTANCNSLVEIQDVSRGASQGADVGEWCYAIPKTRPHDSEHWRVTHIAGEPYYNVHNIGTKAFLEYQLNVTVETEEGIIVNKLLSNKDQIADLGDKYGKVQLIGNLLANEFCENPAINYDVLENAGNIKFADRDEVSRYISSLKNLQDYDNNYFKYEDVDPGVGADVLWYLMSSTNGALNNLYKDNKAPNGCYIDGNRIVCEPETEVAYPNMKLTLKSSFIGISEDNRGELENLKIALDPFINVPTNGIPKIMIAELSSEKIYKREVTDFNVAVKNIGTDDDTFTVDLTCGVEEISFGGKKLSVKAGETREATIRLNGNDGRYVCKATATSVNVESNYDEKSVTIIIEEREEEIKSPEFVIGDINTYTKLTWSYIVIGALILIFIGYFVYKKKK